MRPTEAIVSTPFRSAPSIHATGFVSPVPPRWIPPDAVREAVSARSAQSVSGVLFRSVISDSDYRAVVALRYASYRDAGKLVPGSTEACMSDQYDSHSLILAGVLTNRIVATTRLTYANADGGFELEEDVGWPAQLPPRDTCVEVTRTCTSLDCRGSGIFQTTLQQLALHAIWLGKRYIVIAATPGLARVYRRIGFVPTPYRFKHKTINGLEHQVMLADAPAAMCGVGVDPITWARLWRPVAIQLSANNRLDASRYAMAKRNVYEALARGIFSLIGQRLIAR